MVGKRGIENLCLDLKIILLWSQIKMNDELIKTVVEGIIKEYLFEAKTSEAINKIKSEIAEELQIPIQSIKITQKDMIDDIHFTVYGKNYSVSI